jgi:alpha-L-arabinofuranosidase
MSYIEFQSQEEWRFLSRMGAIICAVLALSMPTCFAQPDQVVYADALANGWQNYGWATLDYECATPVHSGNHAIQVVADKWQALYLHHEAFDSSLYASLSFWINGGPSGGQRLRLQATLNGVGQTVVKLAALPTNSWQRITLSLAELGVAGKSGWDGFWIQDRSGSAQPAFYVDDISLLAAPAPAIIQLTVDAARTNRLVDARIFGLNTAVWDSRLDTAETLELLRGIDCQALRFPGGSLSDEYHWAENRTGTNPWTWATSFDSFARLATNLGARICLTVNYGSGTPSEAAAWVQYANVTKGYGCRYWEIGNENYGEWEKDDQPLPHDPYTYAVRAKEYLERMKDVDPAIKVGVVAVTGEDSYANGYTNHPATNPRTGKAHNGWTPVMLATLKQLGVTPDFLIYHRYAQNAGREDDAALLQSSASWPDDAADLRAQLTDYLGANGAQVELVCTENNSVSSQPGKQTTSLVNALFLADSLAQVAKTEFNGWFWWDLRNSPDTNYNNEPYLYGWREYGDYGLVNGASEVYPAYYAMRLLRQFARGGDAVVEAASDYLLLSTYAARRADGTLTLLVINKSASQTLEAQVRLTGFQPQSNGLLYLYGIPQDEAARTGTGSMEIAQAAKYIPGNPFTCSFEPYSLTVISLAPAVTNSAIRLQVEPMSGVGTFQFVVIGDPGQPILVQRSADLIHWEAWQTNDLPARIWGITETETAGHPALFYRALKAP